MLATFSINPADGRDQDGDYAVYRNRVLFKAGDYPEHRISISEEDLAEAVRSFRPVAGNVEHTDFLAGQACFVDAIRVDDADPSTLRGDVRIPRWLDEGLSDREKKVSAEWSRKDKTFKGLALTVHPHIAQADLLATFAKHSSRHGRAAMQMIHDTAAAHGAYCSDPAGDAGFVMRHERTTLQKIHDHAVESGAVCHGSSAMFSHSTTKKGKPMGLYAKILRALGQDASDEDIEAVAAKFSRPDPEAPEASKGIAPEAAEAPAAAETVDFSKDPRFVALERQNAEFRKRVLAADALAWADAEIKAERALPPQRDSLVALFTQATLDDAADEGLAKFSDAGKALGSSRVEMLKAIFAKQPRHMLYRESLADPAADAAETTLLVVEPKSANFSAKKADEKELEKLRGYSQLLSGAKK